VSTRAQVYFDKEFGQWAVSYSSTDRAGVGDAKTYHATEADAKRAAALALAFEEVPTP